MGRRVNGDAAADSAEVILHLAVLLEAGLPPVRAWEYLASVGQQEALRVARACERGEKLVDAIAGIGANTGQQSWREVSVAWSIAATVGAPLAQSLRNIAVAMRDTRDVADEVRVVLAEPAGTARLMGWLPLVAIGLGFALGVDTVGVLFTNPIGVACLVGGIVLVLVARRWTATLARAAAADVALPGLGAELVAIALSGGVAIERARSLVSEAGFAIDDDTDSLLALSRTAGVPALELLRASAVLARHRARTEGRLRAARLSTRLLLPLGVCTLPAFLLLGVAPMLLGVLSSVSIQL
ncbi:type II secretion system F family protein [Microbacterium sp. R86528]|uniref:type II secretion system F family protein n=1 Tax=Microbacterium sp. R86528 TaxID=3093864 RepID=UPI0037CB8E33